MLLVFGAPCQLVSLAGQEHGRTIPLTDVSPTLLPPPLFCPTRQTRAAFLRPRHTMLETAHKTIAVVGIDIGTRFVT
jgi:hypothetical protein